MSQTTKVKEIEDDYGIERVVDKDEEVKQEA